MIAYPVELIRIVGKPGLSLRLVELGHGPQLAYSQPPQVASAQASLVPQPGERDIAWKPRGLVALAYPPSTSVGGKKELSWLEENWKPRQIEMKVGPPQALPPYKVTLQWFPGFVQDQVGMADLSECPPR